MEQPENNSFFIVYVLCLCRALVYCEYVCGVCSVCWMMCYMSCVYCVWYVCVSCVCCGYMVCVLSAVYVCITVLCVSFLSNFYLCIYLFLAALGLRCCMWTFSSCGQQGLRYSCGTGASHCSGFSCCRTQSLGARLSNYSWSSLEYRCTGLVALRRVWSSQTRNRTGVPCIGRWILNHWATWDVLCVSF